jgi:hypothetical protein
MALDDELTESPTQNWVPDEDEYTHAFDDTNNYIKLLQHNTGLKLLPENIIRRALDEAGKLGLSRLFIANS